jgi:hypothetical protein
MSGCQIRVSGRRERRDPRPARRSGDSDGCARTVFSTAPAGGAGSAPRPSSSSPSHALTRPQALTRLRVRRGHALRLASGAQALCPGRRPRERERLGTQWTGPGRAPSPGSPAAKAQHPTGARHARAEPESLSSRPVRRRTYGLLARPGHALAIIWVDLSIMRSSCHGFACT